MKGILQLANREGLRILWRTKLLDVRGATTYLFMNEVLKLGPCPKPTSGPFGGD